MKYKIRYNNIFIIVNVICFLGCLICIVNNDVQGYELLSIHPLIYSIVFNLILFPIIISKKSYTVIIFSICSSLRYILLPILLSIYPNLGISSFYMNDPNILNRSILFMAYELIVYGLYFMYFFFLKGRFVKEKKQIKEKILYLKDGNIVIYIFIIFFIITMIIFPQTLNTVNFFIMKAGTDTRVGANELGTFDLLLRQIFVIGQLSLYIVIINYLSKKYKKYESVKFVYIALLVSIFNLGIIVGEQRSTQVYFTIASIYVLRNQFYKHKNLISKVIILSGILMIFSMTIYKHTYAFKYDSYIEAMMSSNIDMEEISKTAEIYLLGPQSVAASISMKDAYSEFSIDRLIFDFMRSFIGLNFLVKNSSMMSTSNIFNLYVTGGKSISGYLLPIGAQGYIYFGYLLGPLLMILMINISLHIENIFTRSESLYVSFFALYMFSRVSTCIISSNLNSVITSSSLIISSAGIIYLIQMFVNYSVIKKGKFKYAVKGTI